MALQSSGAISLANIQTEFGGSNPISLSEYYGVASGVPSSGAIALSNFYGTSAIASAGLYEVNSFAATSSTSWTSFIQNLESYKFQSQFRIVFRYQNGTSGTAYQGDFQIDTIIIQDMDYNSVVIDNFESDSESYVTSTGSSESGTYSSVSSWTTVPTSTTTYRWNRRTGGTPSGGTGVAPVSGTSGSYYLYAETSGTSSGIYYWLRSPTYTWSYATKLRQIIVAYAAYGSNVGTLKTYIEVL